MLYTDGVTEAIDGAREEFGDRRLLDSLKGSTTAEGSIRNVLEALRGFAAECGLRDDLTLLALRFG